MSKNQVQLPEGTAPYKKATLKPISDFTVEEGFNNRKDFGITQAEADRLAKTFEEDPYKIPPVTGFRSGGKIVITDGERRLRLAQKAGIPSLPFIPTSSDLLSRLEQQATNNSGKSFTDVENAALADALSAAFVAQNPEAQAKEVRAYVCGVMGISQATFYNYAALYKAPEAVQEQVQADNISLTAVREIMSETSNDDELIAAVDTAIADAKELAAAAPAENPGKGNRKQKKAKATKATRQKAKAKKTPFEKQSYSQKLAAVIDEVVDSPAAGAQLLVQLDAALKAETPLEDIVALVVGAEVSSEA
jgi:ParB-like chromosome segregation protein Spo0J